MEKEPIVAVFLLTEGRYLPGVPAHDLTAPEAEAAGGTAYLFSTGAYGPPKKPAAPAKAPTPPPPAAEEAK